MMSPSPLTQMFSSNFSLLIYLNDRGKIFQIRDIQMIHIEPSLAIKNQFKQKSNSQFKVMAKLSYELTST